jgi:hypothetical protein
LSDDLLFGNFSTFAPTAQGLYGVDGVAELYEGVGMAESGPERKPVDFVVVVPVLYDFVAGGTPRASAALLLYV